MLDVVANLDDVGNCHYMLLTFHQLVLQFSKCLVYLFSLNADL